MLVCFNPFACEGRANRKLRTIFPALRQRDPGIQIVRLDELYTLNGEFEEEISRGNAVVVAAGGDGTVHHVLNFLLKRYSKKEVEKITLGAVGLGSSNDFHKPFSSLNRIAGIPVTLDAYRAIRHDIIKVTYRMPAGAVETRYFLLNASCGITARANWLFNHPDRLLRFLKKTCTALAILYAAIKTILTFKGVSVEYSAHGKPLRCGKISNIAFLKKPYCSGSFCYDSPYHPDDGRFWVHTCLEMPRLRLLKILARLARHRFMGTPGTESYETSQFVVKSNEPFALEMDGEVVQALEAHFAVVPRAIQVCQP